MNSELLKIKHSFMVLRKWEFTPLCLLIVMVLVLHFATISTPKDAVFDEAYYVPAANSILHGLSLGRLEHPPLGQSIIASGIWLFGNNPFGWRFFSVIFGAVSLVFFYFICRELNLSKYAAFLAVTLLAVDNLSFTQASTAMLDVFCLTFMFASVWFYLQKTPVWTGVFIGLAALCKLTGVFALLFIGIHWLVVNPKQVKEQMLTIVTSGVTFLGGLVLLDAAILHQFLNPFDRLSYMLRFADILTFSSYHAIPGNIASPGRPWEWLYHEAISYNSVSHVWSGLYDSVINPGIWILIIPVVLFLLFLTLKRGKAATFALCWFVATYVVWIPITLITNRLTYEYYFYPAVGAICIGIALLLSRINNLHSNIRALSSLRRILLSVYVGAGIIFFVFLYDFGNIWFRMGWAVVLCFITLYYLDKFTPEEPIPDNSLLPNNPTLKP
jgi:predicted membrane-bound dolichyl-phosphate-mannose-protein mannosyltransferase